MITLFPSYDMSFKGKIMIFANLILFISFIASLIFRDISFIIFALIILIILYYVYYYYKNKKKESIEKLNIQNIDINNNYNNDDFFCIKPSKNNPFMNPNIIDDNNDFNNNFKACNIDDCSIKNEMNNYFKQPVYKDVNDIFENNFSQRQFYTVPATTIPNDQESFAFWLYNRKKTCKENNGEQCFNNIM